MSDRKPQESSKKKKRKSNEIIKDGVNAHDYLCGRGNINYNHPGNCHFRKIVSSYKPQYIKSKPHNKRWIAEKIVEIIHESGGRFLQKINDIEWINIGDKKAIEKTSQVLRNVVKYSRKVGRKDVQECPNILKYLQDPPSKPSFPQEER